MSSTPRQLTPEELEITLRGKEDPNIFFDYWFRKKGADRGWQLDHNFTEKGKWQKSFCMASQTFIVAIAGISTGKSLTAALTAAYYGAQTREFKFLNVAREGWQSQLMYNMLLEHAADTPFDDLIVERPKRPYPKVGISYLIGETKIYSTLEFMSVGESGDATNLFSWRGDWINIEEAGRIDNLSEIVSHLVTRLTGSTSLGRPYIGRLSLISNPWDNVELWQLFDMAYNDKEDGLVYNIDTEDNKNTTEKQVKLALKLIPEDQHKRFMTGERPKGRGEFFASTTIEKCESKLLSELLINGVKHKEPNYVLEQATLGVWHTKTPRKNERLYWMVGDPGTDAPPARNAPCIMVFDVTDAPTVTPMVAFWWGNGHKQIMPFVNKLYEWKNYYHPIYTGIDSTGTQKYMAEILNVERGRDGKLTDFISGIDFSNTKKNACLISLRISMEGAMLQWPHIITGIGSQLGNYDDKKDRGAYAKLPQDIVATLAMAAFSIRSTYDFYDEEDGEEGIEVRSSSERAIRHTRETTPRRDARRSKGEKRHSQR